MLPLLDGLAHVASVESVVHVLEATYLDTEGLALSRAGITSLRLIRERNDESMARGLLGWVLRR